MESNFEISKFNLVPRSEVPKMADGQSASDGMIATVASTKRYNSPVAKLIAWILAPGIGPGLMLSLNASILAMMGAFYWMYSVGVGAEHAIVLGILTVGLFFSVNWYFIVMLQLKKASRKAARNGVGGHAIANQSGKDDGNAAAAAEEKKPTGGPVKMKRRRKRD